MLKVVIVTGIWYDTGFGFLDQTALWFLQNFRIQIGFGYWESFSDQDWIIKFQYPHNIGAYCLSEVSISVEQIGDFFNPNPVQNFHLVIRSDPNPENLSEFLIQSGLYP